jgi:hypothetical protein
MDMNPNAPQPPYAGPNSDSLSLQSPVPGAGVGPQGPSTLPNNQNPSHPSFRRFVIAMRRDLETHN